MTDAEQHCETRTHPPSHRFVLKVLQFAADEATLGLAGLGVHRLDDGLDDADRLVDERYVRVLRRGALQDRPE